MYKSKSIKPDILRDLIDKRNELEMTPVFKLTENHVSMSPQERQNVKKAAELLSRTTAKSLRWYYHNNPEAEELASFIEAVDSWFSVSNSYSPIAKLDYKKSYIGSEEQKLALHTMFDYVENMRAIGKTNLQVFQKSILMHITSLMLLFDDMKIKHGVKFISTYKVNFQRYLVI